MGKTVKELFSKKGSAGSKKDKKGGSFLEKMRNKDNC